MKALVFLGKQRLGKIVQKAVKNVGTLSASEMYNECNVFARYAAIRRGGAV
jgi:hypothetical protein